MPLKTKERKQSQATPHDDDFDSWMRSRQLIKPDDQLDLHELELQEEIPKVLLTHNTNIIKNLVVYSFKEGGFVPLPYPSNVVTLYSFEGTALHIDSPEAKGQIAEYGDDVVYLHKLPDDFAVDYQRSVMSKLSVQKAISKDGGEDNYGGDEKDDEEGEEKEEKQEDLDKPDDEDEEEGGRTETNDEEEPVPEDGEREGEPKEAPKPGRKMKKLINQFNYCERAALTYNNPSRAVQVQTIAPSRSTYSANILQWIIYDSYAEDFEAQEKLKEKQRDKKSFAIVHKSTKKKKSESNEYIQDLKKRYLRTWQILERIISQNIYDDVAQDYRYWDDPSDEFREQEGTLLPLWKFSYDKAKGFCVTDVCFNPHYYDLYAVSFGSFDFLNQPSIGYLCLFTIKNPAFPDYRIETSSGVMCCDIHPKYPYLVVIGMFDGNTAVYNLQLSSTEPVYRSKEYDKHYECVFTVRWGIDLPDGEINFYSAASDGNIVNWVLMQNKLLITTNMRLHLPMIVPGPDGTDMRLKGCATAMRFHPQQKDTYLCGIQSGLIFKCSVSYSSKYLMTYAGHYMSVYELDYNRFNPDVFISCSCDWRVKIWEDMRSDPLFIFDLGASVGDVKWAPYSSTVFAAVTIDGKVHVFDLNVNRFRPICVQQVVPKRTVECTRLVFNEKLPFILVGDNRGMITSLKLSPNLRLRVKPPKKATNTDQTFLQTQKLEKLLSLVREQN